MPSLSRQETAFLQSLIQAELWTIGLHGAPPIIPYGEQIARAVHREYAGSFKELLAMMRRRGILVNDRPGYRVAPAYLP